MAYSIYTFYWHDSQGNYKGVLDTIHAEHDQELNGDDTVTFTTFTKVKKGERLVWADSAGFWHEHVIDTVNFNHGEGKPVYSATGINSFVDTYKEDFTCLVGNLDGPDDNQIYYFVQQMMADSVWTQKGKNAYPGNEWITEEHYSTLQESVETNFMYIREAIANIMEVYGGELYTEIGYNPDTHRVTSREFAIYQQINPELISSAVSERGTARFQYSHNASNVSSIVKSDECYAGFNAIGAEKLANWIIDSSMRDSGENCTVRVDSQHIHVDENCPLLEEAYETMDYARAKSIYGDTRAFCPCEHIVPIDEDDVTEVYVVGKSEGGKVTGTYHMTNTCPEYLFDVENATADTYIGTKTLYEVLSHPNDYTACTSNNCNEARNNEMAFRDDNKYVTTSYRGTTNEYNTHLGEPNIMRFTDNNCYDVVSLARGAFAEYRELPIVEYTADVSKFGLNTSNPEVVIGEKVQVTDDEMGVRVETRITRIHRNLTKLQWGTDVSKTRKQHTPSFKKNKDAANTRRASSGGVTARFSNEPMTANSSVKTASDTKKQVKALQNQQRDYASKTYVKQHIPDAKATAASDGKLPVLYEDSNHAIVALHEGILVYGSDGNPLCAVNSDGQGGTYVTVPEEHFSIGTPPASAESEQDWEGQPYPSVGIHFRREVTAKPNVDNEWIVRKKVDLSAGETCEMYLYAEYDSNDEKGESAVQGSLSNSIWMCARPFTMTIDQNGIVARNINTGNYRTIIA